MSDLQKFRFLLVGSAKVELMRRVPEFFKGN